MDSLDLTLLGELMKKGRSSWADLAHKVGLSSPGLLDRIRRLEEKKIILGYRAIVSPEALGLNTTAFVSVSLDKPSHRSAFLKKIKSFPEIQECHRITGDFDFLLKIRCFQTRDLDQLVNLGIKSLSGVSKTQTIIVMGTEKETSELPIPNIEESETA
ncbi:MAG: Lrp/AsnC family transcriptional regulator [Bacteriovoracaceae bacterium]|nr:Lrp/AsnC family transcriptional regulator [Bacteriovoracaceae bacterium]